MSFKRVFFISGCLSAIALSGCNSTGVTPISTASSYTSYASVTDAGYKLPAIPRTKIPERFQRQIVTYQTTETPGTIVVDTKTKFLYLVMPNEKAMRYGIGVGKQGFEWSGITHVAMKREWPTWTPPEPMLQRRPELAEYRDGMGPGLENPLGARALYLFNNRGDSGYRLHGTPEWWSMGRAVSSGCIRLINQDVIDLYDRVEVGAKVLVI